TYLIPDVDVFYANDVHRDERNQPIVFSKSDVEEHIRNTNKTIERGGQCPSLTKGHPTREKNAPTLAECVNFRISPRREGQACADIVGVPENLFQEWKAG